MAKSANGTSNVIPASSQQFIVEIITVAYMQTNMLGGHPFTGPAYDTAIADMAETYPALKFLHYVVKDDAFKSCQDWATESDNRLAELYYRKRDASKSSTGESRVNFTVFILSGCDDLIGTQRFATGLNKVVISTAISNSYIYDKINFPTYVTTNYLSVTVGQIVYQRLLRLLRWSAITILADTVGNSNSGWLLYARAVRRTSEKNGIAVGYEAGNISSPTDMAGVFKRFKATSRVMLVFADANQVRNFLVLASKNNFTADGAYAFVIVFPIPSFGSDVSQGYSTTGDLEKGLREAYRVCLFLVLDPDLFSVPPRLAETWKNISRTKYNYTYGDKEQISPTVGATYASTVMIGQVVNELRQRTPVFDWKNGRAVAKAIYNRTFSTIVGSITLSEIGERLTIVKFNYLNDEKNDFLPAFQIDLSGLQLKVVEVPTWPGPWPVPSEPKCGFQGDNPDCQPTDVRLSVIGGCLGSLLALSFLAVLYWVNRKMMFWNQLSYEENLSLILLEAGHVIFPAMMSSHRKYTYTTVKTFGE